jgi:uncharacterized cofD-like protein
MGVFWLKKVQKMVELRDMKHVVTIGGGTGSYTILSGLKTLPDISLTALVSMADDGGSTGVLRDELGVLPPGDVRQCLVALSEHSDVVRNLMSYRFEEGTLSGHSFGNIFLAALEKVTGDFVKGVEIASEILKVRGKVVPITKSKAKLSICLSDGTCIEGENTINHADLQTKGISSLSYAKEVELNPHARRAIIHADVIILGPGNYYCSLIPNLIVKGFKDALQESHAKLIFPVNLTNKQGHTLNWKVSDYVEDVEKYLGKSLDSVLVNNELPSEGQIIHYKMEEGDGVLTEDDMGNDARVIREKLLSHALVIHHKTDSLGSVRSFIRHDKDALAKTISKIL